MRQWIKDAEYDIFVGKPATIPAGGSFVVEIDPDMTKGVGIVKDKDGKELDRVPLVLRKVGSKWAQYLQ